MKKPNSLMVHVINNNLSELVIGFNAFFQMMLHQAESGEAVDCADFEELKNWAETISLTCDKVIDAMKAGGSR